MDDERLQSMTKEQVKGRFHGHDVLYSKYIPRIPVAPEREYIRVVNAYMRILKEELEKELPLIKEEYKADLAEKRSEGARFDSETDLAAIISRVFARIKKNILAKAGGFGLRRRLEGLANMNRKLTVKEWKRAIKATLGIDIREDYYMGNFYKSALDQWVHDNVNLIVTIPQDTLGKMEQIVYDGWTKGRTTKDMVAQIQNAYGISKRHAQLIARDQTAKLNADITQHQQQDAGIDEYIWSTSLDRRVRDSHRKLEGTKHRWDDPPIVDERTGRRAHPGQDFQCRCCARPVFKYDTLNLPMGEEENLITINKTIRP